jgi:diguanylate cyclase (GGDEF)-like protein/PAS domain S-box-containing protein
MRRADRLSLRARVALLLALPFLMVVALLLISFGYEREAHMGASREQVLRLGRLMTRELHESLLDARLAADSRAFVQALESGDARDACERVLAEQRSGSRAVGQVALAALDGRLLCSIGFAEAVKSVADLPLFQRAGRTPGGAIGLGPIDAARGFPTIALTLKITAGDGSQAVAIVGLSRHVLQSRFDDAGLPAVSSLTLVNAQRIVLYRHPHGDAWVGMLLPPLAESRMDDDEGSGIVEGPDGVERLYGYVRQSESDGQSLYVIVGIPRSAILSPLGHALFWRLLIALGLLATIFAYAAWRGERLFVRPIIALTRMADRVRKGDFSSRVGTVAGSRELRQLSASFDAMVATLAAERQARDKLNARFARLPAATACVDRSGRIDYANAACESWIGREIHEIVGRRLQDFLPADIFAAASPHIERARQGHSQHFSLWFTSPKGAHKHAEVSLIPEADPAGFILFVHDATAYQLQVQAMTQLAQADALTGLPNRRAFTQALEGALRRAAVEGTGVAVLFADLDRFKEINDSRGHRVGDIALQAFASLLGRALRQGDIIARLSGDEFAVLLQDVATADAAATIVSNVRAAIEVPQMIDGVMTVLHASVGAAYAAPGRCVSAEALLEEADADMYRIKRTVSGRPGSYAMT